MNKKPLLHKLLTTKVFASFSAGIITLVLAITIVKAQNVNSINVCAANGSGLLRLVSSIADCKQTETPLSWQTQTNNSSASGLKVYDSQNQEVGLVLDPSRVARQIGSRWVFFEIWENKIPQTSAWMEYASTDCTGTPYMEYSSILGYAKVIGNQIYYMDSNTQQRHMLSAQNLNTDGTYGACEQWDHERINATVLTNTLPNFIAPFHVSLQ